ncbi:MAG: hypothetical protein EPN21_01685 [Methylococcaceae bacterium]|nr:MAG: hypothetical protein EPN21_01685 [Methylococcaceae bacterium]
MFSRILLPALLAGSLAALVLTVAQALWVTPLILQAETYENAVVHEHGPAEAEAWQPETETQRLLATALGNTVLALGYGLIFMGLYLLRRPANALQGLAWGLAGFTVFFAAPSLGLPPELPGTASGELLTRQHWWLSTVAATALGLGLLFLQQRRPWQALGVLLLTMPHLIGAPQIAEPISLAPEALQTQFRLLTLACNALFWSLLGLLSAAAFRRFCR